MPPLPWSWALKVLSFVAFEADPTRRSESLVKALKREVYEEIVCGGPAGSTAGTFAGKQGCKYSGFRKGKVFALQNRRIASASGSSRLCSRSYEAEVVKPLMHFSSIVAAGAGRSCRSKSKAKIPRGSGLTKKPNNNTPSRLTSEELFFILYRMMLFAESNSHIASLE